MWPRSNGMPTQMPHLAGERGPLCITQPCFQQRDTPLAMPSGGAVRCPVRRKALASSPRAQFESADVQLSCQRKARGALCAHHFKGPDTRLVQADKLTCMSSPALRKEGHRAGGCHIWYKAEMPSTCAQQRPPEREPHADSQAVPPFAHMSRRVTQPPATGCPRAPAWPRPVR